MLVSPLELTQKSSHEVSDGIIALLKMVGTIGAVFLVTSGCQRHTGLTKCLYSISIQFCGKTWKLNQANKWIALHHFQLVLNLWWKASDWMIAVERTFRLMFSFLGEKRSFLPFLCFQSELEKQWTEFLQLIFEQLFSQFFPSKFKINASILPRRLS